MLFSSGELSKIAKLAKLELSDAELELVTAKLSKVLDFVAELSTVDTTGVEEMAHPIDVHSVVRGDAMVAGLSREAALKNAPEDDGEFFLVPPVLG